MVFCSLRSSSQLISILTKTAFFARKIPRNAIRYCNVGDHSSISEKLQKTLKEQLLNFLCAKF